MTAATSRAATEPLLDGARRPPGPGRTLPVDRHHTHVTFDVCSVTDLEVHQ
jgi:hypothetical protein